MWLVATSVIMLVVGAGLTAVAIIGHCRWRRSTGELRGGLEAARLPANPSCVDFRELDGLPPPVQRYFREVLSDGAPMLAGLRVRHAGTFNLGQDTDKWKPFRSEQRVVTRRPGFDWNGRVTMLPGVPVRVHDAYVAGEGVLHAAVFGLFPVAGLRGGGEIAEGELMRFLAEAVWYPTALLPSQGIRWEPADERSAFATLNDGGLSVTLLFSFDTQGLVTSVSAKSRGRMVGARMVSTPWQGRFWDYAERSGMKVPLAGAVAWLPPGREKTYWRGRIIGLDYEFAP